MTQRIDRLMESQQLLVESQNRLTSTVATLAGNLTQLAHIVEAHERRIERLEGQ